MAHIVVQSLATRAVAPQAPLHLVYAGCVIPDLPWVLQRVVKMAVPGINAYDLRLYSVTQASFALSLVFCGAVALAFAEKARAFVILASGCALHLLLDPLEVKWANGVSWFVPFHWGLTQFNLFWPEHWIPYALTLLGFVYFVWHLRKAAGESLDLSPRLRSWISALVCLMAYLAVPFAGIPFAANADNHYAGTLRSERVGAYIEFDRAAFTTNEHGQGRIRTFAGEWLDAVGIDHEGVAIVSVRGQFADPKTVRVSDYHFHDGMLRDLASYCGLAMVAGLWGYLGWKQLRRAPAGLPNAREEASAPTAQ